MHIDKTVKLFIEGKFCKVVCMIEVLTDLKRKKIENIM